MSEPALASKRIYYSWFGSLNIFFLLLPSAVAALSYRLLGLQSYYTAGEKEVRAWTVPIGSTAVQAVRTPFFIFFFPRKEY